MTTHRNILLGLLLVSSGAYAQSFSFSSINVPITGGNSTYTTSFVSTGTGTATFTGLGSTTASITAFSLVLTRERGLNCGAATRSTVTFSFNATDSLTLFVASASQTTTNLSFTVTGGTGAYAGRSGSGTVSVNLTQTSLTTAVLSGSGSGNLTPVAPVAFPIISASGIVPVYSTAPIIQPGSWVSIYGSNFATGTTVWDGNFPTTLANVIVRIDNKPAYLWFVSPTQINLQVPDDITQGCVSVSVTTPTGTASANVTLEPQQPSFSLLDTKHVVGTIAVPNGSGAYGSGVNSYDIVGPAGAFSYKTRPVKVGESLVLYGVGFGPTKPAVPAGQVYTGAGPTTNTVTVTIGGQPASVAFSGIVGAGLYQINVVVPQVPSGENLIQATVNGVSPVLFSSNTTQNCQDPDPQGAVPANCSVYVTVQ